jgi:hypothetical protein
MLVCCSHSLIHKPMVASLIAVALMAEMRRLYPPTDAATTARQVSPPSRHQPTELAGSFGNVLGCGNDLE